MANGFFGKVFLFDCIELMRLFYMYEGIFFFFTIKYLITQAPLARAKTKGRTLIAHLAPLHLLLS